MSSVECGRGFSLSALAARPAQSSVQDLRPGVQILARTIAALFQFGLLNRVLDQSLLERHASRCDVCFRGHCLAVVFTARCYAERGYATACCLSARVCPCVCDVQVP